MQLAPESCDLLVGWPVEPVGLAQPSFDRVEHPCKPAELLGRDPLEIECVHEHVPPAVHLADDVHGGNLDFVEERLAEEPSAESRERPHLDPGRIDRAHEHRNPSVLRVTVGAHSEVDPVGELCARRPDFVARDNVGVAAQLGPRRQRTEIAARSRFGEPLTEDELAPRDRR